MRVLKCNFIVKKYIYQQKMKHISLSFLASHAHRTKFSLSGVMHNTLKVASVKSFSINKCLQNGAYSSIWFIISFICYFWKFFCRYRTSCKHKNMIIIISCAKDLMHKSMQKYQCISFVILTWIFFFKFSMTKWINW